MDSETAINIQQVKKNFENRQAIYIEGGALRVRVTNIRATSEYLAAQVEEIPTPGLTYWSQRWDIGAGNLTKFSDHTWRMGYGGWGLYFAEHIVKGVVDLASQWPEDLDWRDRYKEVLRWIDGNDAYEQTRRVFPDESGFVFERSQKPRRWWSKLFQGR